MSGEQSELLPRPEPGARFVCQFRIKGEPIGKGRPRARLVTPKGKKPFISMYTDSQTRDYEDMVKRLAQYAMLGHPPIERAVELNVTIYIQIPDTWPQWKRDAASGQEIMPTTKPDISNVVKSIEDAMNGVVYKDDSQIVSTDTVKLFHMGPTETVVRVRDSGRALSTVSSRAAFEAGHG